MKDYQKQTIDTYNAHAQAFDDSRAACQQSERLLEFIQEVPGKKVLDLGCGPGRDLVHFVEKGFVVTGIDLSNAFVALAKQKVPQATVVEGDILDLPFDGDSFDGVWASASLVHFKKEDCFRALQEIYRVLVLSGIAYISIKEGQGEEIVTDPSLGDALRFFSYYTEDELCDMAREVGFTVISRSQKESQRTGALKKVNWVVLFLRK